MKTTIYNKVSGKLKAMRFLPICLITLLPLAGCTDYLDKSPLTDINEEDPYKNYKNFQGFTDELYNCIPLQTSNEYHSCWNFGEDEYWEPNERRLLAYDIDQGNFWGWSTAYYNWMKPGYSNTTGTDRTKKGRLWGLSWYAIRKANIGLANLSHLVDATPEQRNLIAGQLYFFRGWYYFMLMQYWGGLPYLTDGLAADAVMRYPRLSYQETADSAAADFQRAADLLPVDWDQTAAGKATLGKNNLRINKVMALCYLGKDLLWAGSPLMNKESTGSATYNQDYCKRAAEAFGQALKICDETGRYQLADFKDYTELFYTYNQNEKLPGLKEAIFMENLAGGNSSCWRWNLVNDFRPQIINGSGIKAFPTANYVDYFGMANGKPLPKDITKKDADSGYDPEHPFRDRDPRFYKDIVFDGVKCVKDGSRVGNKEERQYASLYTNGDYRKKNPAKACFTGYMNMKFVSQYMNDWDGYKDGNVLLLSFMRLADIYLMYAEAAAQAGQSPVATSGNYSLTAVDAVNKIRERAGAGDVAAEYASTLDGFMSELRRERAVELAFEGHRFTDLRRWMLLTQEPYTLKTAVYFDRAKDQSNKDRFANPEDNHVLNLHEKVLLERKFSDKHYWLPFLKDDVTMYPEFKQNPGW